MRAYLLSASPTVEPHWLGRTSYSEGLSHQEKYHQRLLQSPDRIAVLAMEHDPVVTVGVRGSLQRDLPLGPEVLKERGVELVQVRRGGEATLHAPGQLVIYPLVPLRAWQIGVREFVEGLEWVTQRCLARFGVVARKAEGEPGLYTADGKVAFFGIRVDRGVSTHGLSINVDNDLSLFDLIRSCGRSSARHAALSQYADVGLEELFSVWLEEFKKGFSS